MTTCIMQSLILGCNSNTMHSDRPIGRNISTVSCHTVGHVCGDEMEGPVASGGYMDELFQFDLLMCQKVTDVKLILSPL